MVRREESACVGRQARSLVRLLFFSPPAPLSSSLSLSIRGKCTCVPNLLHDRTQTSPTLCICTALYPWRLRYYILSKRGAFAYGLYASSYVLLPSLVTAVVLFYGGQLVMEGQITGGKVRKKNVYTPCPTVELMTCTATRCRGSVSRLLHGKLGCELSFFLRIVQEMCECASSQYFPIPIFEASPGLVAA